MFRDFVFKTLQMSFYKADRADRFFRGRYSRALVLHYSMLAKFRTREKKLGATRRRISLYVVLRVRGKKQNFERKILDKQQKALINKSFPCEMFIPCTSMSRLLYVDEAIY